MALKSFSATKPQMGTLLGVRSQTPRSKDIRTFASTGLVTLNQGAIG
ncbi:hypothetical protein [Planktothrix tepida]|nr:hypothetical protein [Planktothrix tepida]